MTDHELLERMDENLAGQRRAIEAIEKASARPFFEQVRARMDAMRGPPPADA